MKFKRLFWLFFITCCCFDAKTQNVPYYVPTNGLVGWWSFSGNANDESGYEKHGVVNGAVLSADRFGFDSSAYYFNNDNSFINCGAFDLHGLTKNSVMTLCYWTFSENDSWPFIYKYHNGVPHNSNYALGNNGGNILITGNGTNVAILNPTKKDSWMHIGLVFDGLKDLLIIYYNGSYVGTYPINLAYGVSDRNLIFGPRFNVFDNSYKISNGKLDDIGIWRRALTPYEISKLYKACIVKQNKHIFFVGDTVIFKVYTVLSNPTFIWQADFGSGFVNLTDNKKYVGTNTNTLIINNISLNDDDQPFRVIVNSGNISDTSKTLQFLVNCKNIVTIYDTVRVSIYDTVHVSVYDTVRVSVYDTLIIKVTDIALNNLLSNLKIYPNPAKTFITIDYGDYASLYGYTIELVSSNGVEVYKTQINQKFSTISISSLTKGLYYIKVKDSNNSLIEVKKLVIQ
ncbi:MAG: T9SS type A sorting domain-containing protein [Bacteroidales bacterium]|nr:T9SS type A sorting domain-containing protein [Bacteroidales bacterium]